MNRAELIQSVSEKRAKDLPSKAAAERIVDTVIDTITEALKAGDKVSIRGFGTFKVKQTAKRQGRNVATGETITIPAHKSIKFVVSEELKQSVR